jgi:aryl-alcohol dehydrogenase-like predicted oxidoreductase
VDYRNLGRSGLKVSAACLGTMTFGWVTHQTEAARITDMALDAGINFIDTADIYSGGASEEIVGRVLEGKRNRVVIATKVRWWTGQGPHEAGLSRAHILRAVEASLRRLKTDYIDLYQVHAPDPETLLEETLHSLDDLVHQGKVRYIGCSNFEAWQLLDALSISRSHGIEPFASVQPIYNLLARGIEPSPSCLPRPRRRCSRTAL